MTHSPYASTNMIEVLVVEDDPLLRMDAVDLVEDIGFKAIEAANADEAIRILGDRPGIRVLFTDVEMPGSLDGVALARRVHEEFPRMGIVIVSGHPKITRETLPLEVDFFSKPYPAQRCAEALRRVAERSPNPPEPSTNA